MTLRKSVINVPIGGGLRESQHEDLFDPPAHNEVVNVTYDDRGALLKRYGVSALPTLTASVATYGNHSTVAEHQGRAVVLTHEKPYVHDEVRGLWTSLGAGAPMPSLTKCDPLLRGNNTAIHIDSAVMTYDSKTVVCVVWCDRDLNRVYYQIVEVPDDGRPPQIVYGPKALDSLMNRAPRVATLGQRFMIIGYDDDNADLRGCYINMASGYVASASVLLHGVSIGVGYDLGWEIVTSDSHVWTISSTAATTTRVRRYDDTFTSTASVDITQFTQQAACYHAANDVILITSRVASGNPTIRVVPSDCSSTGATVTLTAASAYEPFTRSTIVEAPNGGVYVVWSSIPANSVNITAAWHARLNGSYGTVLSGWLPGSIVVAGMAAWDGSDREPVVPMADVGRTDFSRHGWLCRPTTNEANKYVLRPVAQYGHDVVDVSASYVGSFLSRPSLGSWIGNLLPSLVLSGGYWLLSYQVIAQSYFDSAAEAVSSADFLRCLEQDSPALRNVSAQSIRVFGGGTGVTYTDSVNYETSTPPILGRLSLTPASDADLDGFYPTMPVYADHWFSLAFRWTDSAGNIHRSVPFVEFKLNGFSTYESGGVYYPLRQTFPRPFPAGVTGAKDDQRYELEVYGGTSPGELYLIAIVRPEPHPVYYSCDYIVIGIANITYGFRPGGYPEYFTPGYADPSVIGPARWSETELTHIQPPATIDVCSTQDRVWLLSAERGRADVWPSKLLTRGYAPEFPSSLRVILPNEGGEAVALAALDDKIIVFKERQIYAIFGSPGDNTGANATLQRPRLISGDVGCISKTSVVEGPYGIVFLAPRGFHMLSRGLEVSYIGNDIERTFVPRDNVITSGTLIPDRKQVRWTYNEATLESDTAKAVVWSYEPEVMAFSTFDSVSAVSAATRRGQWIRVTQGGQVLVDQTSYSGLDDHSTRVTTAWIKTAGLQGFARVYTALFFFKWFTGYIKIEVGYDHDPDWIDTVQWTNGELASLAEPNNGRVQLMVYPTRQKCEAIRFRISEVNPGGQNPPPRGAGHEFVGLSLEVGRKASNFRKGLGESNKR